VPRQQQRADLLLQWERWAAPGTASSLPPSDPLGSQLLLGAAAFPVPEICCLTQTVLRFEGNLEPILQFD